MYRSDKQFMTNPATAPARIYIGFLAKTVVAANLEEKFKVHGKILGLVLQQGFAFIQYENHNQAQAAIQKENFTMLHGRKITVKQAVDKSQKGPPNQNQFKRMNPTGPPTAVAPPPPQAYNEPPKPNPNFKPPSQQEQSSVEVDKEPPPVPKTVTPQPQANAPPQNQGGSAQPPSNLSQAPKNVPQAPKSVPSTSSIEGPPKHDIPQDKRGKKRRVHSRDRFLGPMDHYRDDYYPYSVPPVIDQQPDRNDCEIIVVSKLLTKYAEYIEQRLKALGLIVDLLFPNEDVPIGRVLANISSRGCLFAILIMPQNEEHRSLTLNVLHGIPQEHRNMPIEDALVFITRNFDAYMRGDKTAAETLGSGGVMNISDRHPTSVQLLLNLLAENRQITSVQYDRLVTYLQERREVQHKHEIEEGVDQTSQESNSKQAELQSRIMNILNKTANETPAPVAEPPPPPVTTAPPPLLKDPSVQKALDSLLGGEIFKSISSAL